VLTSYTFPSMIIQQSPSLLWRATSAEESLRDMIHKRRQRMFLHLLKAEKERRRGASAASCASVEASPTESERGVVAGPPTLEESPDVRRQRWLAPGSLVGLQDRKPCDLDVHVVGSIPNVYYVPNVLKESEESEICGCIAGGHLTDKWISLRGRQLQNWGGVPPNTFDSIPYWLQKVVCGKFSRTDACETTSVP
jgi:hypothetical protein